MNVLLTTAYWPNLHYFYYLLNANQVTIEQHEHYQKQSYRNRTSILTANGVLDLTIPVKKTGDKQFIKDLEISYTENWQIKHWRAITSAYKNSPYFDFFEEDIKDFYTTEYSLLLQYNKKQLETVFKLLRQKKTILFSSEFEKETAEVDLRELIHPKKQFKQDNRVATLLENSYYQTFDTKFGFTPNLSILDLLFNKGLESLDYFPKEILTL